MIVPRFHHQMFHCSTIRYSAVPLPGFPLFHHLCSTDPPSLLDCSTTRCSTVSPSDVLQFHDDCSTIPPLDGPLFHFLCFTVPLYLFHFSTMIVPLCYHEIFDCSTIRCSIIPPPRFHCSIMTSGTSIFGTSAFVKPQWHFVYSPSLGLAWQNLTKQARYFWFHTTFSFSKEINRYLLSEQYSTVTWIEILLKPYLNYACFIFPLSWWRQYTITQVLVSLAILPRRLPSPSITQQYTMKR